MANSRPLSVKKDWSMIEANRSGGSLFLLVFLQVDDQVGIVDRFEIGGFFLPRMVVMADNIADLLDQIFPGAQFGQDLPGNRRAFFLLVAGGCALVFSVLPWMPMSCR